MEKRWKQLFRGLILKDFQKMTLCLVLASSLCSSPWAEFRKTNQQNQLACVLSTPCAVSRLLRNAARLPERGGEGKGEQGLALPTQQHDGLAQKPFDARLYTPKHLAKAGKFYHHFTATPRRLSDLPKSMGTSRCWRVEGLPRPTDPPGAQLLALLLPPPTCTPSHGGFDCLPPIAEYDPGSAIQTSRYRGASGRGAYSHRRKRSCQTPAPSTMARLYSGRDNKS